MGLMIQQKYDHIEKQNVSNNFTNAHLEKIRNFQQIKENATISSNRIQARSYQYAKTQMRIHRPQKVKKPKR